jgi:dephospho-CoA kinase
MLIGLTGGIASGKSTVADLFAARGIPVVSADKVYHEEVIKPGSVTWQELVDNFGEEILLDNQEINRRKLGELVFRSVRVRHKLNEITHPPIVEFTMRRARELLADNEIVLVEIPLLFETKSEHLFDLIVVVFTDRKKQVSRLMERDQLTIQEARYRIHSQSRIRRNIRKGDYVIYNNNDLASLENEVDNVIKYLKSGGTK